MEWGEPGQGERAVVRERGTAGPGHFGAADRGCCDFLADAGHEEKTADDVLPKNCIFRNKFFRVARCFFLLLAERCCSLVAVGWQTNNRRNLGKNAAYLRVQKKAEAEWDVSLLRFFFSFGNLPPGFPYAIPLYLWKAWPRIFCFYIYA